MFRDNFYDIDLQNKLWWWYLTGLWVALDTLPIYQNKKGGNNE